MNSLTKMFDYEGKNVRVIIKDGQPWWVAKDVCDILEFVNASETIKRLEKDEVSSIEVMDSLGRKQLTNVVNEFGLYNLILGSRKSEAKPFQRWVTHEVLPQIRNAGAYISENSDPEYVSKCADILVGGELTDEDLTPTPSLPKNISQLKEVGKAFERFRLNGLSLDESKNILKSYGVDFGDTSGNTAEGLSYDYRVQLNSKNEWLTVTELAIDNGIYSKNGKPAKLATGAILTKISIDDGEVKEFVYKKYGQTGLTKKYTKSVSNKIGSWLVDNQYPKTIEYFGGKRDFNYNVLYENSRQRSVPLF